MRLIGFALVAVLLPIAAAPQATPVTPTPPAPTAPPYRGFAPGAAYRDFATRARALAGRDTLLCDTSRKTAQLMECGVTIVDPTDSAHFYLSAYVLEGKIAMVAFYDSAGFKDTRGVALLSRTKRDLTRVYGRPSRTGRARWEWRYGRQDVRLAWRGRGTARWVRITLMDSAVMDRISAYVKRPPGRRT